MIRRKRLTVKQRQRQTFRQSQPIGLGQPRAEKAAITRANHRAVVAFVRQQLVARVLKNGYGGIRCEACNTNQTSVEDLQMHELVSRARTRRRPPYERFDRRWCMLVCGNKKQGCHEAFHSGRLAIAFESVVLGCDGQKAIAAPEHLTPWNATALDVWKFALAERKRLESHPETP